MPPGRQIPSMPESLLEGKRIHMAKRVAIVGMSFRFPSTNTQQYWNDLLEGKDLVTEVAPDRWSRDAYLHPGKEHPGTAYTF